LVRELRRHEESVNHCISIFTKFITTAEKGGDHLSEWRISFVSWTTGSMSRRISASAALNGSGGSGVPTTGGLASFEVGGSAGGAGSPAVGGPERSRRRGTGAAHGMKREARRRKNGAPARGRERAAAMPPEREGLESVVCRQSSVEWIDAQQQFDPLRSPRLSGLRQTSQSTHVPT